MGPARDRLGESPLQVRLLRAACLAQHRRQPTACRQVKAPKNWWADPASGGPVGRRAGGAAVAVDSGAIDEECREKGTRLCVLVVGPVANYAAVNGESPLARIIVATGASTFP